MSLVAAAMAIVDLVPVLAKSAEDHQEPVLAKSRAMEAAPSASTLVDHRSREEHEAYCLKGVMHLSECGITRLPDSYVLPASDRPAGCPDEDDESIISTSKTRVKLPVVDMARLRDPGQRAAVLETLDAACREYGFFQVVNHGVGNQLTAGVLDVARRFFDLPFAERARYMSPDVRAKVRYGTSFNQVNDTVLCWRDFLKLVICHDQSLRNHEEWPQEPADLREVASRYAMANHALFMELMEALLQALGVGTTISNDLLVPGVGGRSSSSSSSSQMMTMNCYPACPQPELTLGMPPHSDYGLLTLVLQDHVEGLQVMHKGRWLTVDPIPGSFVVNVGDHLEIYSNGRYKSVLHRVLVNSSQLRISIASFHTVPADQTIGPAPELVDDKLNPPRYMDTDFATFLAYIASAEGKHKTFLQSRKLPAPPAAVPSL